MAENTPLRAPVSVDFLRRLSKDLPSYIPVGAAIPDESINKLSNLLDALVGTAFIPYIPASQRAGACNPLCSLLEKCQASPDERIRSLIWSKNIWSDLFDIFLERYDNAKPKSMRQVLLLLCSILQKDRSTTAQTTRDRSVARLFDVLFQEDDTSRVKPALSALSHFIQKDVLSVDEMITMFEQWDAHRGQPRHSLSASGVVSKTFLCGVMNWANHQDTTPAAGNAVCVILEHARRQQAKHFTNSTPDSLPIWVEPLETIIRRNPDAMLNFKSHVFPDLFKPVLTDYLKFLEHLHLDDHVKLKPSAEDSSRPSDELETYLLFTSLQVGKDMGFVQEVDHHISKSIEIRDGIVLIPDSLLGRLLAHERAETRLAAFALLTTSAAVTRPLTLETFAALKRNLPYLHADTDANFRGEIMSLTLSLFERLRGATGAMSRHLAKEQKTGELTNSGASTFQLYHAHIEFIQWYLQFISSELHPTAAYQRHISALKALTIVMKSGLDPSVPHQALSRTAQGEIRFPFQLNILNPLLVRELFDLVMDPFDDVRYGAAFLLKLGANRSAEPPKKPLKGPKIAPVFLGKAVDSTDLVEHAFASFLERAERTMLRSGRADHADGVARAYDLLFERRAEPLSPASAANSVLAEWMKSRRGIVEHLISLLDETIAAASSNLSIAVNAYPMHGTLSALRYIFDQPAFYASMATMQAEELEHWKTLHNHILGSLRSIWGCVRNVLCVDAPEGHVPEDMEEEPDLTTKDILSYSWRGLKEASTLLRVIVAKAPFDVPDGVSVMETTEFEGLGRLCFLQLAELRHRGAFSTVAQTFAAFCLRCSRSPNPEIKALLDQWYEETLRCIRDKGSMITRRSAGLPSLITGILTAAPDSALFERVIDDLQAEAAQEGQDKNIEGSNLPQVHALNCLKDIFTNTKLALASEPYVAEGLSLAASRLESKVWAIRNCGLMLFRALIDRLLGSSTTQNWKETDRLKITRLSYKKYPNLLDIIVQLLTPRRQGGLSELTNTALEGVFPAFQILQRARPPVERRAEIQGLVFNLTSSSHWHVRDMAARTLATLLSAEERVEWILALLEVQFVKQNALHGILSSVKYLVKEMCQATKAGSRDDLELVSFALSEQFNRLYTKNICPLTKSAYLDIVTLIQKQHITNGDWQSSPPLICEAFGGEVAGFLIKEASAVFTRLEEDQKRNRGLSAGDSLLRRAFSLFAVQQLVLQTCSHRAQQPLDGSVKSLFGYITAQDRDTCRITLESLSINITSLVLQAGKPIYDCIGGLLGVAASSNDLEVAATVRHTVALLLDRGLKLPSSSLVPIMLGSETKTFGFGSPSLHEGALPLLGRYIDAQLSAADGVSTSENIATHLSTFIHALRCDLEENNPFPTRFAAISALSTLHHFWRLTQTCPAALHAAQLALAAITYDALNDDDDEVRDAAAAVATRVVAGPRLPPPSPTTGVAAQTKSVVPLAAARKVAVFLAERYRDSGVLCAEALHRLLSRESGRDASAPEALEWPGGFAGLLREARGVEESAGLALFAREKQNLFIDPVRECSDSRLYGRSDRTYDTKYYAYCSLVVPEEARLAVRERKFEP
ncbi:Armadillo-like helical [Macrophomina phaseolina MS6]|uniref:Armadillo-like helical n=1 Tax=Macrophomina phaseolina (strain MS6) TaxID=1126212 RepID=K2R8Z7_MACPH|nr:Armadillo-like helical [Macrophomina phaseolina MS6]